MPPNWAPTRSIGMRYDATEIMQGVTEVLAYGTAVYVEKKSVNDFRLAGRAS